MEKSCLLLSFSLDSSTQVDATETDSVMSLEGTSPLDFFNDRLSEHKSSGAHKWKVTLCSCSMLRQFDCWKVFFFLIPFREKEFGK